MTPVAWSPRDGRLLLFGGRGARRTRLGELWSWQPTAGWEQHDVGREPPPRYGHALAYDPDRERLVVFGGSTGSGYSNRTWEWNGRRWSEQKSPARPLPRTRGGAWSTTRTASEWSCSAG